MGWTLMLARLQPPDEKCNQIEWWPTSLSSNGVGWIGCNYLRLTQRKKHFQSLTKNGAEQISNILIHWLRQRSLECGLLPMGTTRQLQYQGWISSPSRDFLLKYFLRNAPGKILPVWLRHFDRTGRGAECVLCRNWLICGYTWCGGKNDLGEFMPYLSLPLHPILSPYFEQYRAYPYSRRKGHWCK